MMAIGGLRHLKLVVFCVLPRPSFKWRPQIGAVLNLGAPFEK